MVGETRAHDYVFCFCCLHPWGRLCNESCTFEFWSIVLSHSLARVCVWSVCLSVCLAVSVCVVSVCLCLSVFVRVCVSVCSSVFIHVCVSVSVCACLFVCLSAARSSWHLHQFQIRLTRLRRSSGYLDFCFTPTRPTCLRRPARGNSVDRCTSCGFRTWKANL